MRDPEPTLQVRLTKASQGLMRARKATLIAPARTARGVIGKTGAAGRSDGGVTSVAMVSVGEDRVAATAAVFYAGSDGVTFRRGSRGGGEEGGAGSGCRHHLTMTRSEGGGNDGEEEAARRA